MPTSEPVNVVTQPVSSRAQEILTISASLFEQHGYSATTMNEIADAAGVLPGSLYHHFESKDTIAVALLEAHDVETAHLAHRALKVDVPSLDREGAEDHLRDLTRAVVESNLRHAAAVRLRAYNAPLVAGKALRRAVRSESPALALAWSRALAAVVQTPGDYHRHPELLQFTFQRLTLGARISYPHHTDANIVADQIYDLLMNGLLVTSPPDSALDTSPARKQAERTIVGWRRPERDRADDKERILAAARIEFARHGYEASTIREIAETAGITMGTLYRRTESKEAILREILQRYSDHLDEAVRGLLTEVTSAAESLDALARLFVHATRRFSDEAAIVKLSWNAHRQESSPFHDYLRSAEKRSQMLTRVLAAGIADGTVRSTHSAAVMSPHFRQIMWLPYQSHARTSERLTHTFIRQDILAGAPA